MSKVRYPVSRQWTVDDFSELATIDDADLSHGDDAYIINDDTWHKYNKPAGTWQLLSDGQEEI